VRRLADVATAIDEFSMSIYAFKRPPAVNLEATMSLARPPANPLEEFAGLMGVDVNALERFDGAGEFAPTPRVSHEPAASKIEGSPRLNRGETSVQGSSLPSEATHPAGLYRSAERVAEAPPMRRRSRALTLRVLVAVGIAGWLGAWALKGAPGAQESSTMEADDSLKAPPTNQEAAALRDKSTSTLPGNQTGKPEPANLESIEKRPSVFEEQTKPPTTTPAVAATLIPTETAPSAMPITAPVSASAAPPVTRSIALLGSASEQTQVPVSTPAPPTAPTVFSEPKGPKAVSVRSDGSDRPNDDGTHAGANHSERPSVARTSPAPSNMVPPLLNPPTPVARPSFDASAGGALKPVKARLDVPASSVDIEPVARTASTAPNAPPPANVAADPSGGDFSAKSVLQFVPNLYEDAASALLGSPPATPVAATNPAASPTATVAAAPSGGSFSADSVLQFVPNLYEKAASALHSSSPATQIARADPRPTAAGDEGIYGVQLGTPTTELAARRESDRLRSKFAIELGGLQPTVRQAEVRGGRVYQVRIGGLSKADAEALCLKLRSGGREAACSVASD
jgi:SPOR domain